MILMPQEYENRINELFRDQTQTSVCVYLGGFGIGMSSGVFTLDEDTNVTGGHLLFNTNGGAKQPFYCASFERGGWCVGDPDCIFMDNETGRGHDNWNENVANSVCIESTIHNIPSGQSEVYIEGIQARSVMRQSNFFIEFAGHDYPTKVKVEWISGITGDSGEIVFPCGEKKAVIRAEDIIVDEDDICIFTFSFAFDHTARLRLSYIAPNDYIEFKNSEIISLSHDISCSLLNSSLPTNDLNLTVWDFEGTYDPTNPNGQYSLISASTCMQVYYGYEDMMILRSCLYENGMPTYANHQLTMKFTDLFALATETRNICCYPSPPAIGDTLTEKTTEITRNIKLYNFIDDNDITTFGDTLYETSAVVTDFDKTQLAQLEAMVTGNLLRIDRLNPNYFPLEELFNRGVVHKLTSADYMESYPVATLNPTPSNVKVNRYRYYCDYNATSLTVEQEVYGNGEYEIPLEGEYNLLARSNIKSATLSVAGNVSASVVIAGASEIQRDDVKIKVVVSGMSASSGKVKVEIDIYEARGDVSTVLKIKNPNGDGEDLSIDNPLITNDIVATRVANNSLIILSDKQTFDIDISQDFRIELGDIILIDTEYEKDVPVIVTDIHFSLPSRFGSISVRRITL